MLHQSMVDLYPSENLNAWNLLSVRHFVYMLLFHVHLPRFGDILIWLNHSKTVNAASIHGRLISIWKFECMKSSFCPTFVYMLLFHVHLPCFGDILIWLNHSKTHCTIRSKVFHIWHSDPYMDRLRPSREYT